MQYYGKIEKSKIARRGHSTTDALLFMLQAIYEAVACAVLGVRVFFVEFSKGFDLIDYKILMTKLRITGYNKFLLTSRIRIIILCSWH